VGRIARPSELDHPPRASRTPAAIRGGRSPAEAKRSQRATTTRTPPDPATFKAAAPDTASTPSVVRSFASRITTLDGVIITIERVRQQLASTGEMAEPYEQRRVMRSVSLDRWQRRGLTVERCA
jgi:hypothetical protein